MNGPPEPIEIRRIGDDAVRILWNDGHQSEYPNSYLRENCPCAFCSDDVRGKRISRSRGEHGALRPERIGVVGRYAVTIEWSDGHKTGIYTYRALRGMCPCRECRSAGRRGG